MIEIRHILCLIDFSDFSRRAVDCAVALAKWYGSTVTCFAQHVVREASCPVLTLRKG